jgi:hypothetical protein
MDRVQNAIKLNTPKGLRKLLSEYIRLSCLLEIQKTSMLDIRLEIKKITTNKSQLSNQKKHIICLNSSIKTRHRSLTQTKIVGMRAPLLIGGEISKPSICRSRSFSAQAAYI